MVSGLVYHFCTDTSKTAVTATRPGVADGRVTVLEDEWSDTESGAHDAAPVRPAVGPQSAHPPPGRPTTLQGAHPSATRRQPPPTTHMNDAPDSIQFERHSIRDAYTEYHTDGESVAVISDPEVPTAWIESSVSTRVEP